MPFPSLCCLTEESLLVSGVDQLGTPSLIRNMSAINFFGVVDGTPSQNWLFGRDLDFDQMKMGRPVLAIWHSREQKKTRTPSCGPGCMYTSSHAVSHTTGLSHRASTQIMVERPLLVGEKTCYLALFPPNCTDYHKQKGLFLESCSFMWGPVVCISDIRFRNFSKYHCIVPLEKLSLHSFFKVQEMKKYSPSTTFSVKISCAVSQQKVV